MKTIWGFSTQSKNQSWKQCVEGGINITKYTTYIYIKTTIRKVNDSSEVGKYGRKVSTIVNFIIMNIIMILPIFRSCYTILRHRLLIWQHYWDCSALNFQRKCFSCQFVEKLLKLTINKWMIHPTDRGWTIILITGKNQRQIRWTIRTIFSEFNKPSNDKLRIRRKKIF